MRSLFHEILIQNYYYEQMTTGRANPMHKAFTEAYTTYVQELMRRARFMIDSPELSEDIVQEVYIKMWLYLARGGKIYKTRAFLYHALNNVIVDAYRKRKTLSLDAMVEKGYETGEDDSDRLLDILDGRTVLALISKLPRNYQKVLRMKYAHGLPYGEISRTTGQSKNTVAVQVHRGLKKLKDLYIPA